MKLKKLRDKLQSLIGDLETHKATYENLERDATKDELKRANDIMDSIESIQEAIKVEERAVNKLNEFNNDSDDKKIETKTKIELGDEPQDRGFESFGSFLVAVANAENPSVRRDERLLEVRGASGMSEGVAADGGYLVQKDYMSEILAVANETGLLYSMITKVPIGANSNGIKINYVDETSRADGSRWGGVRAYWQGEAAAFTKSKPKFGQIDMSLQKLTALYYATDELLADTTALGSVATKAFGEELGFKIDDAIINGTGAGMPQGIMNAAAKIEISKETSQAADTVVAQNIMNMYSRMYARGKAKGVWLINGDVWPQLFNLQVSTVTGGVPLFFPPGGISGSPSGQLMGRPIKEIEQCPTVGDAGDIIFADLSQYVLIDKGDPQFASSMHVRFIYDEMTFRVTYRANGQSSWTSAKTPFKGSATRSPFIAIEART